MFRRIRKKLRRRRTSVRVKLTLSMLAIAIILLTASVISMLEYGRMSNYVSEEMAENIHSLDLVQQLVNISNDYNLQILAVVGDDDITATVPDFDSGVFLSCCDSLRTLLAGNSLCETVDSVEAAFVAYVSVSKELNNVLYSDFIDTRTWYFDRFLLFYASLGNSLTTLSENVFDRLEANSATFDRGFYRSIIPGAVAVAVGILLVLLLLFFILTYYVNPLVKMLGGLDNYRSVGKKYGIVFDGDDQLSELNDAISEIIEENIQMRRRVKTLREKVNQLSYNAGGPYRPISDTAVPPDIPDSIKENQI